MPVSVILSSEPALFVCVYSGGRAGFIQATRHLRKQQRFQRTHDTSRRGAAKGDLFCALAAIRKSLTKVQLIRTPVSSYADLDDAPYHVSCQSQSVERNRLDNQDAHMPCSHARRQRTPGDPQLH